MVWSFQDSPSCLLRAVLEQNPGYSSPFCTGEVQGRTSSAIPQLTGQRQAGLTPGTRTGIGQDHRGGQCSSQLELCPDVTFPTLISQGPAVSHCCCSRLQEFLAANPAAQPAGLCSLPGPPCRSFSPSIELGYLYSYLHK